MDMHEVSLQLAALMAAAEQKAACSDWGDTCVWKEALTRYTQALGAEACLSATGRVRRFHILANALTTRLLLIRDRFDEAPASIVDRPAFVIAGLPRTGSTLLQRLLALDDETDGLRFCDVAIPHPATKPGSAADQQKIAAAREILKAYEAAVPGLSAMHPMEPEAPEEEFFLIDLTFMSSNVPCQSHVPGYWSWVLEHADHAGIYQELKQLIAYLGQYRCGSRWVLKAPHHMWMQRAMLDAFPQAQVIWTHRDPARVVPSFASLCHTSRQAFSDDITKQDSGQDFLGMLQDGLARASQAREQEGEGRFIDVHYHELMSDPAGVVRRIYQSAGLALPSAMPQRIERHIQSASRGRHGAHRYCAADFGLTERQIRDVFATYIDRFDIPVTGTSEAV